MSLRDAGREAREGAAGGKTRGPDVPVRAMVTTRSGLVDAHPNAAVPKAAGRLL